MSIYQDYEFPKVSIIIPTYNSAALLALTVENLLLQTYPDFEIVIVDGGSTDRTVEIAQSARHRKVTLCTVSGYHRYEMINKGIAQSSGQYVNILFPGDYYLYVDTLTYMMGLALAHSLPDLLFCGTLIREGRGDVEILFRHLSPRLLRRGIQPTSLQSCWFLASTFDEIGKFDTSYAERGGFELLCRFSGHKGLRAVSAKRILIDYDTRTTMQETDRVQFIETFRTLHRHFGLFAALRWCVTETEWLRYFSLKWKRIKMAFGR